MCNTFVACVFWLMPLAAQAGGVAAVCGVACQQLLLYGTRAGACRGGITWHGQHRMPVLPTFVGCCTALIATLHVGCHHMWDGPQSNAGITAVASCFLVHGEFHSTLAARAGVPHFFK